ncbi:MAG: hypothetical protein AB8B91_15290 [Rubripirellula sp.]
MRTTKSVKRLSENATSTLRWVKSKRALKYNPGDPVMQRQRQHLIASGARSTPSTKPQAKTQQQRTPASPRPSAQDAAKAASVNGKYSQLLVRLQVPGDVSQYGKFYEYGR